MIIEFKYRYNEYDWEDAIIEDLRLSIRKRVDKYLLDEIKNDN